MDKLEESEDIYKLAKKIYPNNCRITSIENPMSCSCIFNESGLDKVQKRLKGEVEFLSRLCDLSKFELSRDQRSMVYNQSVDNYLFFLEFAFEFYFVDLKGRSWVLIYFTDLEKVEPLNTIK